MPKKHSVVDYSLLGKNIQKFRLSLKVSDKAAWTQEKVAERTGIGSRYYQQIELGKASPSLDVIAKLRQEFNCDWNTLFKGL